MDTGAGRPKPYVSHDSRGAGRPTVRRRRGAGTLLPLGIAAWALGEIWLLTLVGQAAGGLTVFALLVGGVVLGAAVVRWAGRRAWRRLAASLQPRPADEPGGVGGAGERPTGGGLTMLGGLLLMVPGLGSDALGVLCLFPPTAALLRRAMLRYLRASAGPLGLVVTEARQAEERVRIRRYDGRVVPGEVVDRDDDRHRHDRGEENGGGGGA